jgi:hypothetical protein
MPRPPTATILRLIPGLEKLNWQILSRSLLESDSSKLKSSRLGKEEFLFSEKATTILARILQTCWKSKNLRGQSVQSYNLLKMKLLGGFVGTKFNTHASKLSGIPIYFFCDNVSLKYELLQCNVL